MSPELSAEDFTGLKTAIEKLGKAKTDTEAVTELKKELEDYQEDVQDLTSVSKAVDRLGLKETRGAKMLHTRCDHCCSLLYQLIFHSHQLFNLL